ncbi:MAG: YihY/virulence factor BrkB family protein, partial [Gammaproteobacteria bacterium]
MTIKIPKQIVHWLDVLRQAGRIWLENNAFAQAGSLAFFTLFSIAPVIIVVVSIIGLFFGEEAAQGQIVEQLQETIGTQAAEAVQAAVMRSQLNEGGIFATIAGVAAMLLGATTVFAQMQHALNNIWGVVSKPSRSGIKTLLHKRLTSLTLVMAIGFIMLVSLSMGVGLRALFQYMDDWLPWYNLVFNIFEITLSLLIISALFAAIFRVLPDVQLSWRDVALGAVITALLFTLGRTLIAFYLAYTATASTFGAAGSLVLLLLWVNYSSLIL